MYTLMLCPAIGLVFAIIEGPEWGWLSGGVLGTFALALLGGAAGLVALGAIAARLIG